MAVLAVRAHGIEVLGLAPRLLALLHSTSRHAETSAHGHSRSALRIAQVRAEAAQHADAAIGLPSRGAPRAKRSTPTMLRST